MCYFSIGVKKQDLQPAKEVFVAKYVYGAFGFLVIFDGVMGQILNF